MFKNYFITIWRKEDLSKIIRIESDDVFIYFPDFAS